MKNIFCLGIQPMTFPQMPGYVVIPQNQLAQLQQLQEQALRQQLQQQQDQIKKYENETKQLLNKQQNQTNNQNNKNQKDRDSIKIVHFEKIPYVRMKIMPISKYFSYVMTS